MCLAGMHHALGLLVYALLQATSDVIAVQRLIVLQMPITPLQMLTSCGMPSSMKTGVHSQSAAGLDGCSNAAACCHVRNRVQESPGYPASSMTAKACTLAPRSASADPQVAVGSQRVLSALCLPGHSHAPFLFLRLQGSLIVVACTAQVHLSRAVYLKGSDYAHTITHISNYHKHQRPQQVQAKQNMTKTRFGILRLLS
jgi:hypothetical protein